MSVLSDEDSSPLLTVDELAAEAGLTVRTLRYYASMGLVPPAVRRGRVALYGRDHAARLGLVRALQDHGFTMSAIEKAMARIPASAGVEDLAVQRAVLTSWAPAGPEVLDRRQLDDRAGRALDEEQVALLIETGVLERVGRTYSPLPGFEMSIELLDVEVPADGIREAADAIERHMGALTDELTEILRRRVLEPYRAIPRTDEQSDRLEVTMQRLRALTLQAVVSGFQRATNAVISRSLR
ncbi:MerR family transcriptional regulator [Aeromicrobium sp. A1-2]|uniref:MerR family transcriptional regulator n=1 Tax=Aeromicrobium sp. A1-2 TaxID=2107713 RepID=UPI0013C375C7|nr:MerR family transcriptional regulator [Aeromicrobium sp. A1-2]